MLKKLRYTVRPYLATFLALGFTLIAAWPFAGRIHLPILMIGLGISLILFLLARSNAQINDEALRQVQRAREIHEQLNTQLEQHRKKLNELLSQMPGVVWELHGSRGDLATTFISEYVEKILGYAVREWVEDPTFWVKVLHGEDRDRVLDDMARVLETGAGGSTFRWIAKDGRVVWFETDATAVLDAEGRTIGIRGVAMDITERHNAEESLRDREQRFQIALSAARMASWHW